jgi:RHS repeat-associated protein
MVYPHAPNTSADTQQWTYDNVNNLASRRTVYGRVQSFAYDKRNRQTQMRWSNGADWSDFHYWNDSRLYTATNANSIVTRYYDNAGRMYHDYQNLSGVGLMDVQYTLDADGRVTHMGIPNNIYDQTRGYDPLGRLSTIGDQWRGNTIQYYYDAASNITVRSTLLNSSHITYVINPYLNRIAYRDIYLVSGRISSESYGYDAMNRLTSIYRTEDGLHDSFGYYRDGELSWAQYGVAGPGSPSGDGGSSDSGDPGATGPGGTGPGAGPGGGWAELDGTIPGTPPDAFVPDQDQTNPGYAPSADLAGAAATDGGPADPPPTGAAPSDPNDGFGQPDTTDSSSRTVAYSLDPAGNRNWVSDNTVGTITYRQDATTVNFNQYAQVGSDTVTNGYEHEVKTYQGVNYTYINDTHLQTVTSTNNNYVLAYDALGRCVARTLNGATTYYIYDGEKPIQEIGPAWASTIYGIGVDEPVIRFMSTAVYYFYQDHEGSVTHVANANGLVEQYRYDVFGTPTIRDGSGNPVNPPGISPIHNRFMFTGREWAPVNLGFYEYRARAYHPGLGRFMSEDPKVFVRRDGLGKSPDDWSFAAHPGEAEYNLFRYCGNDPLDFTDPMGLYRQDDAGNLQPETTKEFIAMGNAIEHGNTMDTTPIIDPITVLSGGIAARAVLQTVPAITTTAVETTVHGAERIAGAMASRGGVLSRVEIAAVQKSGITMTQADGATVKVLQNAKGNFNVTISGQRGLITTFKNLDNKALDKLAKKYEWHKQ